jgi:hypothetical protein
MKRKKSTYQNNLADGEFCPICTRLTLCVFKFENCTIYVHNGEILHRVVKGETEKDVAIKS